MSKGIIPGGTSFVLKPPVGPTAYTWTADVARGTSIIFVMVDSRGRAGGSSDIIVVGSSDDQTCLSDLSPSSTSARPTPTSSMPSLPASNTATSVPPASSSAASGTPVAVIAGTVIGALLFLAVLVTMGLFFLRKRYDTWRNGGSPNIRRHSRRVPEVELTYDSNSNERPHATATPSVHSHYPFLPTGDHYDSNPFLDSPVQPSGPQSPQLLLSTYQPSGHQMSSQYQPPLHYQPHPLSENHINPFEINSLASAVNPDYESSVVQNSDQSTSRDSMSTAQRKAAVAGVSTYKPSRFILHTDLDDALPPPNEDGVVELPPQYSERRNPLTGSQHPVDANTSIAPVDPHTTPTSHHPIL